MIELQTYIQKFRESDELLESIYAPLLIKHGVTEEYVPREYDKMMQRARV